MKFCKKEYIKKWREDNKDRIIAVTKAYREKNKKIILIKKKEYRQANKEKLSIYNKKYKKKNRGYYNAISAKRRAAKLQATPAWCETEAINRLYMWAKEFKLHVDHIVPLQNNKVCGLHCLKNLQLLMPEDNLIKSNNWSC